jgi:hypothetical protein
VALVDVMLQRDVMVQASMIVVVMVVQQVARHHVDDMLHNNRFYDMMDISSYYDLRVLLIPILCCASHQRHKANETMKAMTDGYFIEFLQTMTTEFLATFLILLIQIRRTIR